MSLNNRVALVLGAAGILGTEVTRRLVQEGCRVYGTVHMAQGSHPQGAIPHGVTLIPGDVLKEESVKSVFEVILLQSKRLDIVVNTVGGYLPPKPLTEVTIAEWNRMMDVNLKAAFLSIREALRRMEGQDFGRIIQISAMIGLRPVPERIPYAISKAAVSLLIELTAQEIQNSGITINAIAPGTISSDVPVSISGPTGSRRNIVTPAQLADIIVSLCAPAASSINGTTIRAFS
jgi:NAD(P)-dependent dehydrogenase (short-subunit alcohol dehydrogenase family)